MRLFLALWAALLTLVALSVAFPAQTSVVLLGVVIVGWTASMAFAAATLIDSLLE